MKLLKTIWNDLRQGENIDSYLTVLIALSVSILSLFEKTPAAWISSLTLAVLALLAFTNLINRRKMEEVIRKQTSEPRFIEEYPDTVSDDIIGAKELWLVGHHLSRTIINQAKLLEEKLGRKERIKVLLIDPDSEACRFANSALLYPLTVEQFQERIHVSLGILQSISQKNPKLLEVRVIDHLISFGTYSMNIDAPNAKMYIELYAYKGGGEEPRFVLDQKDGHWFEFYRAQLQTIWKNAKLYEFS